MSWEQRNADFCKAQTDAQMAYIEAEREVDRLQTENAKLRALVSDMWREFPKTDCGWDTSANLCTEYDECHGECGFWYRMRELGIEVDV